MTEDSQDFSLSDSLDEPREILDDSSVPKELRHSSIRGIHDLFALDIENEARVLVLYTGGTIGMVRNSEGSLAPKPQMLESEIRKIRTMNDPNYWIEHGYKPEPNGGSHLYPLVLPHVENHRRVIYTIYEYNPILDSCNMTMDDWIQIAKDIKASYELFDGFIILHGTDTLSYTASALSFMLENLGKTVIITGSQIPCFEVQSDGRDNFVGSLIIAGNYSIPEVTVYFNHKLLRGNRTIKTSVGSLNAFDSPNMPPLAEVGIKIVVDYRAIFMPTAIQKFNAYTTLDRNVVTLRLFPSITIDIIKHFLLPPIKGVILQCYGAGNLPSNRSDILDSLKEANDRGIIIIVCTQCTNGAVGAIYESGKALVDAGVIPCSDITPEAALTKLSYVLSKKEYSLEEKKALMTKNIRGEMSVASSDNYRDHGQNREVSDLESLIEAIQADRNSETDVVKDILLPALGNSFIMRGDSEKFEKFRKYGLTCEMRFDDYFLSTPLHIAARNEDLKMVEYLLKNGARVHLKDRNNESPLLCAVNRGKKEVVSILREAGGHIRLPQWEIGERLCSLAKRGSLDVLSSFVDAGVDPDCLNLTHQTPLHCAVEADQFEVAKFLIEIDVDTFRTDLYGRTPLEIAKILNRTRILSLLDSSS